MPWSPRSKDRGAVAVTVAIVMTALLGISALAVDGAYLFHTHAELRNSVDAAALAAASGLTVDQNEARNRAFDYAQRNTVLQQGLQLDPGSITFGQWDFNVNRFFPNTGSPNAVRLLMRLTSTSTPARPQLFFAPILGYDTQGMSAMATASLGNRNLIITLDMSRSMADDTPPAGTPLQPLEDTKTAASDFLDFLSNFPIVGDRSGLVTFNGVGTINRRLTENFTLVQRTIEALTIDMQSTDPTLRCTNIADGISRSRAELRSSRANLRGLKVIVLLTDGVANTRIGGMPCEFCQAPPDGSPGCYAPAGNPAETQALSQARSAAREGVVMYTISLGSGTHPDVLEAMAEESGGEYFHAPDPDDLEGIFQLISARVPVVLVE